MRCRAFCVLSAGRPVGGGGLIRYDGAEGDFKGSVFSCGCDAAGISICPGLVSALLLWEYGEAAG